MLALGGVVSTSGVALGVSAISSQGSAGAAQYDPDNGGGGGGDEDEGDGDGDEGRQLSASSGDDLASRRRGTRPFRHSLPVPVSWLAASSFGVARSKHSKEQ